jgi:hypothetical protein
VSRSAARLAGARLAAQQRQRCCPLTLKGGSDVGPWLVTSFSSSTALRLNCAMV